MQEDPSRPGIRPAFARGEEELPGQFPFGVGVFCGERVWEPDRTEPLG